MAALGALAACSLGAALVAGASPVKPTFVTSIGAANIGHAEIYPGGVTVDPAGNVYIADTGNDDIAAYAPDGPACGPAASAGRRRSATSTTRATSPTSTASSTSPTSATSACR